jgi:hypothetical protein
MAERSMDQSTGAAAHANNPTNASRSRRTPQTCRWSESTLYMPFPEWLDAWDSPWSCRHSAHPGPLETVDTCATCPDWKPQVGPNDSASGIPPEDSPISRKS